MVFLFFIESAVSPISATYITLNLTPGKSPTVCLFLPNPAINTLSFSSINSILPSPGTKVTFDLLFFFNCNFAHFLQAEFGCLTSTVIFFKTIPDLCDAISNGVFHLDIPFALL